MGKCGSGRPLHRKDTKRHSSTIGVAEVSWTQTAGARQYRLRVAKRKWPMSSLVTALTEFLTGIKASDQEIGRLTTMFKGASNEWAVFTTRQAACPESEGPRNSPYLFRKNFAKKYGDNFAKCLKTLVIPTGIEPVTYRLGICRSILLSYGTTRAHT